MVYYTCKEQTNRPKAGKEKKMKKCNRYFEIKSKNGFYGLMGAFETESDALAEINNNYVFAKKHGYDNRHETWIIVCVDVTRETTESGDFLKEKITRFVVETVEFSEYENKFVFVY